MHQLVYVSTAAETFDAQALTRLLSVARRNNRADDVTGMLLYHEGSFFQVLEGDEDAVRRVFHRVEKDPRHRMVTVLMEQPVEARAFGDWTMAFRRMGDFDPAEVPGFSRYLERSAGQPAPASAEVHDLMETFRAYLR